MVPFAKNNEFVLVTLPDWVLIGGYVFESQNFMRAAGPCLRSIKKLSGSDIEPGTNGVVKQ